VLLLPEGESAAEDRVDVEAVIVAEFLWVHAEVIQLEHARNLTILLKHVVRVLNVVVLEVLDELAYVLVSHLVLREQLGVGVQLPL